LEEGRLLRGLIALDSGWRAECSARRSRNEERA
jgi:hypothetical protein